MRVNMVRIIPLMVSVIVAISPPHARAEGVVTASVHAAVHNYQPTRPPVAVSGQPFFEDGGESRTIADYQGAGVVMNFWATWCAPCVREMPSLDRLQAKMPGIRVLALSVDRGGAPVIENFYRQHKITNLDVLADRGGKLMRKLRVRGLPTTLLIDANGNEVGRVVGPVEWDSDPILALIGRTIEKKREPTTEARAAGGNGAGG